MQKEYAVGGPSCWTAALESAFYSEWDQALAQVVQEVVDTPSLEMLKTLLDVVLSSWWPCVSRAWTGSAEVPLLPQPGCDTETQVLC